MNGKTIGLVGIGNIGSCFAEALLERGYDVLGFDKSDLSAFAARGGRRAVSARAVAEGARLILCLLPHEAAATDVYRSETGLLAGIVPGSVVVDLASYTLPFKQALRSAAANRGCVLLDGEVTGTPDMLRARSGTIFISGDDAASQAFRSVGAAVADQVFYLGPFGAATKMKLINNLLSAVHTAAAAEAMSLGIKSGFDPHLLARVLSASSGSSKFLVSRAPMMAGGDFTVSAGPLSLFSKYLQDIPALAAEVGASTPLFETASALFRAALASGRGDEDIAVVFDVIEAQGASDDFPSERVGRP